MKAFVIKNKEGKYYQRCYNQSPFTDDLFNANKYQYKEEAEKILNNSFTLVDTLEVVEITIAEGDLEQENKELKEQLAIREKALELACHDFIRDKVGMLTDTELYDYFIEQAKESMK